MPGPQRFLYRACAALVVVGLWSACSPHQYVDDDDTCSRARPLPPVVLVKDNLDVGRGDRKDCKQIKYFKDATARIEYRIGTAFEHHDLKGSLTLFDSDGQVVDQQAVDPSVYKYEFEVEVTAQRPWYVQLEATEGKYGYQAQVKYVKKDPCSKCTAEEECVESGGNKFCRPVRRDCNPPCDADEGLVCAEGRCVSACNPPCRSGYECNAETRECERERRTCSPRCKRGQYCYRGRCKTKRSDRCPGGCPPGQLCKSGKCVAPSITPGKLGPITGRVASLVRAGQGTIVYINRGKQHGAKRGMAGKLCGKYRMQITTVFATRSKARTNHSVEEIGDCRAVKIAR